MASIGGELRGMSNQEVLCSSSSATSSFLKNFTIELRPYVCNTPPSCWSTGSPFRKSRSNGQEEKDSLLSTLQTNCQIESHFSRSTRRNVIWLCCELINPISIAAERHEGHHETINSAQTSG